MIVVSNTTPLIGLATIGRFALLQQLFGQIYIPQAVYNEATVEVAWEDDLRKQVISSEWLQIVAVKDRTAVQALTNGLAAGEDEAIVLACELNANLVLMDERKGRRKLDELGLNKVGTVGLLLKAKQVGYLDELKPALEKLQQREFRISQSLVDHVLREAGESSS